MYTVLCEVKTFKLQFEGRTYSNNSDHPGAEPDYVLLPKHMAKQYGDAVRVLTRDEQMQKEKEWGL